MAIHIVEQHFDRHQRIMRIWQDWEKRVKNVLFKKACHQLLGDGAVDDDSSPIFTFNSIVRANPRNAEEQDVVQAL